MRHLAELGCLSRTFDKSGQPNPPPAMLMVGFLFLCECEMGSAIELAPHVSWPIGRLWPDCPDARAEGWELMELFPMFLKLEGRPCLVVGAGTVAESKIESLLRCGAIVRVIAPAATEAVRGFAAAGKIVWEERKFLPSDLNGAFLVVAATSSPELHEQIWQKARRDGILCNCVDEPQRCDFYYPAVVRRGPLQIAISTGGRAPSLAQRLRQNLEQTFTREYGSWIEELGRARGELLARESSPAKRREILREWSSNDAFVEFKSGATASSGKDERA